MLEEKTLLSQIGLNNKEAEIYEIMLKLGKVPANKILPATKLKRTTVYSILDELTEKNLIVKDESEGLIQFRARHPYALKEYLENRVADIKTTEDKLNAVLPNFINSYHQSQNRPGVKFYQGAEGTKKAYLEILAEKKEILAYVYINQEVDKILGNFWDSYFKMRLKDNINVRAISSDNTDGREYKKNDANELRTTRLIPEEKFPMSVEKNICGNKVGIFSLKANELIAIIIESAEIAKTERSIFELAWQEAGRFNQAA